MEDAMLVAKLMAYAVESVEPQLDKTQPINYPHLYAFSRAHSVCNIVGLALEKLGLMPQQYAAVFKKERSFAIVREATQEIETQEIAEELRKRSIRFMLLKGSVMKLLYPSPDLRSMCDVDIQYDPSHKAEIEKIMLERGYTKTETSGTDGINIAFQRKPFMNIEFHGVLMDTDIPLYNSYFGANFERTVEAQGSERKYSDEDFFVFMAAHTAKHYFHGGTGLRSIMDMWLYFRKKPQLNKEYLFAELKKIRLDEFVETMLGVAGVLFEGKEPDEKQKAIIEYIELSGTHGTHQHIAAQNMGEISRRKYLFSRLFPPREFMQINYPVLKRFAVLLPLFWVIRLVGALKVRKVSDSDVGMVMTMPQSSFNARKIAGNPLIDNKNNI